MRTELADVERALLEAEATLHSLRHALERDHDGCATATLGQAIARVRDARELVALKEAK